MQSKRTYPRSKTPLKTALAALGLAALSLISACQSEQEYNNRFVSLGTLVDIHLYASDQKQADAAFDATEDDFAYMHATYNPWQAGALARTNALLKAGATFSSGPSIKPLIEGSIKLATLTDNLYNPAIGDLIKLWGFDKDERTQFTPPDQSAIDVWLETAPTVAQLEIKNYVLHTSNPALHLDFGGYAKGYALDFVGEHLSKLGIKNSLINAGGDIVAHGSKGARAWRIGIKAPRNKGLIGACDLLDGESIVTSGDYERFFEHQGIRYHHILDPRTGYPARGFSSVTIIHRDTAYADAMATALFVAGPKNWLHYAKKAQLQYVMLIGENGDVYLSRAMAARVEIYGDAPQHLFDL